MTDQCALSSLEDLTGSSINPGTNRRVSGMLARFAKPFLHNMGGLGTIVIKVSPIT